MSEREDYPAGVPCWVTNVVRDLPAARSFYEGVFGWETEGDADPASYAVARVRGRDVAGLAADATAATGWNAEIAVDDLDAAVARAVEAGGTVLRPAMDFAPIGRLAVLADPAGAAFGVWEQGHRRGAQLVNEPGAWSMSALHATDPEGAIAFYGSLFGWQPEPFGPATMFRLPGYVGGEPGQPVPRDVVAALIPSDSGTRWDADFWIDDLDGALERVEKLGGSVLVPAHEQQPPFRQAVVADPEGGAFSLSQLLLP